MQNFVFYPIIFFLYPVFFNFLHNNLDVFYLGKDILIWGALVTFLIWLLIYKIVKDIHKTGLILSLLIIWFYQSHYNTRFALALLFVFLSSLVVTGLIFLISKTKKDLSKLTAILNFIAIILTGFIIYNYTNLNNYVKPYKPTKEVVSNIEIAKKSKNFPDIYYIIPDEYAGFESLKSYFNYDNSNFKKILTKKGFYVFEKPKSIYAVTIFSIPSAFEMDLLDFPKSVSEGRVSVINKQKLFKGNLITFLKALGYKYIYIQGYWNHNLIKKKISKDTTIIDCAEQNHLKEFLYFNSIFRFVGKPIMLRDSFKEISCQLNAIGKTVKYSSPKFVFMHLFLPHQPFIFNKDGKRIFVINTATKKQDYKNLYLEQLQYTNVLLEKTIDNILRSSKAKPIIIIQSDHGFRPVDGSKNTADIQTNNIMAVYPAEVVNKSFPKQMTPVNLFRSLFNSVFSTNFKMVDTSKEIEYFSHKNLIDK